MKRLLLFVLFAAALPTVAHASDAKKINYTGHYEAADKHPGRVFRLDLAQKGSRVHATFFACDLANGGPKPTGEGDGRVNDEGILKFKFKDNLADEGTATFEPAGKTYRFELRVTKFTDPGALHFYGVISMKKTGDPASSPTTVTAL
jgi:hypothetical protein